MLILSRKVGESVVIPAARLEVVVQEIVGDKVRIGFRAPDDIEVYRHEVWQSMCFDDYLEDKDNGSAEDHPRP